MNKRRKPKNSPEKAKRILEEYQQNTSFARRFTTSNEEVNRLMELTAEEKRWLSSVLGRNIDSVKPY